MFTIITLLLLFKSYEENNSFSVHYRSYWPIPFFISVTDDRFCIVMVSLVFRKDDDRFVFSLLPRHWERHFDFVGNSVGSLP